MSRLFFILAMTVTFYSATAQKIEVKKDKVLSNNKTYLLFEKDGCSTFSGSNCTYFISDTSGNREIVINYRTYQDPLKRSELNTTGIVNYFEVVFLKSRQKAEVEASTFKVEKTLMTKLVKGKLFEKGALNEEAVDDFVLVNGTEFSNRRANIF